MTDKQIILSLTRELEEAIKPKWVKIEEQPPKPLEDVLLFTSCGKVGVGCFYLGKGENRRIEFNGTSMIQEYWSLTFTHWQPLPAPPAEES